MDNVTTTDEHPTDDELARIREWSYEDPRGWFNFIKELWWARNWGWHEEGTSDDTDRPIHRYSISTAGWSGNEAIIDAMSENTMLWALTWQSTRRGGHYVFEMKTS